jgi:hypothetical protein
MAVLIDISGVDVEMLKKQKDIFIRMIQDWGEADDTTQKEEAEYAEGLLNFLDIVQDTLEEVIPAHFVSIKEEDVEFELICCPEYTPIEGNVMSSGDDGADYNAEKAVYEQLQSGNEWAWCTVELKGTFNTFEFSDYLGCCSYASEEEFKEDGYYEGMKANVVKGLQEVVNETIENLLKRK